MHLFFQRNIYIKLRFSQWKSKGFIEFIPVLILAKNKRGRRPLRENAENQRRSTASIRPINTMGPKVLSRVLHEERTTGMSEKQRESRKERENEVAIGFRVKRERSLVTMRALVQDNYICGNYIALVQL